VIRGSPCFNINKTSQGQ